MDSKKKAKLEQAGFKVGSAAEFLRQPAHLDNVYAIKTILRDLCKSEREARGLNQTQVAALAGTSQPNIASLENGDSKIGFDLIIRVAMAMGIPVGKVGEALALSDSDYKAQLKPDIRYIAVPPARARVARPKKSPPSLRARHSKVAV